jgi:hypothetical protein
MLPVGSNTKSSTCSVLSSNCVIWHGADIPCIGLCKSDTVTDVILKLGELVCNIDGRAAEITVNTECLGSGSVTWTDYNDLIQYLTDRLCNLYTVVEDIVIPSPINLTADVASCLQAVAGGATLGVVEYSPCALNALTMLQTIETVGVIGIDDLGSYSDSLIFDKVKRKVSSFSLYIATFYKTSSTTGKFFITRLYYDDQSDNDYDVIS